MSRSPHRRRVSVPAHVPGPADAKRRIAELERERETLLELLAQQQRVSQAGLITSGLAHDVNNHIQLITGTAFLALKSDSPEDWRHALAKVQEQCCTLTEVTRSFLAFVRRRERVVPARFSISACVEETLRLTRPLAKRRCVTLEAQTELEEEVHGNSRLLIQALVNLVTNAVNACAEETGVVTVSTSESLPGKCRVNVVDNGNGIPDTVRRHLFRPFATGRATKGGNGLGLFIVRQNIRHLEGTIRVRSGATGTVFSIDLPVAG